MRIRIVLFMTAVFCAQLIIAQQINYPVTRQEDHYDDYFGVKIHDPYRWLEDENSSETKEWVQQQNEITFEHLGLIHFRYEVRNKLEQLWNFERKSIPGIYKGFTLFSKNSGMQNQSVIYIRDSKTGKERVLLDPNKLSVDGTVSIAGSSVSKDGKYFAYMISRGGSDWNEVFVIDIKTGKQLNDHLKWLKFTGLTWYKDGFFYSRYEPEDESRSLSGKNTHHSVYYHKLNTPQSKDVLVYRNNDQPLRTYRTTSDKDGNFLFLIESQSTSNNALYFAKASDFNKGFKLMTSTDFKYDYRFIDVINGKFLIYTNDNAPRYRLMLVDPKSPERENWTELIKEQSYVMQGVLVTKNNLVLQVLENAYNKLLVFDQNGKFNHEVKLPGIGSLSGLSGDSKLDYFYYGFMSYTHPTSGYKYEISKKETSVYFEPRVNFDFNEYETIQVFYPSKDGTEVPMFITMKKGTELNGQNPVLLYGYGGFNVSLSPRFSVSNIPFLENGGIYVVANIRGGGEFGKEWHRAGTKLQKQNVFDDFIAAAEYLIDNKYTNPSKIAIQGGSNGGLLVAACMIQRPDLFKVALPAVGVLDMLRFHKFTIGWAWVGDYGSSDNEEEFHYLLKYSPLHALSPDVNYPATLITTADHDDRVVPAHSFKFAAALQAHHKGDNPVLIRIDTNAGHGAGKPISKTIDEAADVMSFIMFHLGMEF